MVYGIARNGIEVNLEVVAEYLSHVRFVDEFGNYYLVRRDLHGRPKFSLRTLNRIAAEMWKTHWRLAARDKERRKNETVRNANPIC